MHYFYRNFVHKGKTSHGVAVLHAQALHIACYASLYNGFNLYNTSMATCTFTGHRLLRDLDAALLDRVIINLIKNGCSRFLCGMAKGFDLAAAESVVMLKKTFPRVELVACIPCEGQSDSFTSADRARYDRILSACSEVITLSEEYYKGCMHYRDRFMVDNSDVVVCYLRQKSGGTYYTVKYAKKQDKKIIEL